MCMRVPVLLHCIMCVPVFSGVHTNCALCVVAASRISFDTCAMFASTSIVDDICTHATRNDGAVSAVDDDVDDIRSERQ